MSVHPAKGTTYNGGNPVWKGLTKPSVADLWYVLVTIRAKHRPRGNRPRRYLSPEI